MDDFITNIEYGKDLMVTDAFKQLLFQWFNHTAKLYIESPENFQKGISIIDSLLSYYRDVKYFDELKAIDVMFNKKKNQINKEKLGNESRADQKYERLITRYHLARFKALVKLAGRNTFLPMPSISLTIGLDDIKATINDGLNTEEDIIINERDMVKVEESIEDLEEEIKEETKKEKKEIFE